MREFQKNQIIKDLTYRLNNLMAYDIMYYLNKKYAHQNIGKRSIYQESHVIEPAIEISIVFGRQLLDFLRISFQKKTNTLIDYFDTGKRILDDDVFITTLYPSLDLLPISHQLTENNAEILKNLIKVANKASAHLTTTYTEPIAFENLEKARFIIYELILSYVPDIKKDNLWWEKKDEWHNALQVDNNLFPIILNEG